MMRTDLTWRSCPRILNRFCLPEVGCPIMNLIISYLMICTWLITNIREPIHFRFFNPERFTNDTASGKHYPLLDGGHTALPAIGRLSSTDAMMTNGTTKDIDMSVSVGCENNLRTYPVPYTLRKVYSEAVSKQVRLLTVGDSFMPTQGGSSEYPEYSFSLSLKTRNDR